ncbi:HD domain-containing protein [Geobacter sp. AOG1]|uniref:HD domain-containing protein n=1 Tax=Geobacter sp. AOG1 TaxID=1566346 RepID=UPI001CC48130|nr:HD domain-containing protein [Geobacter sp. AOG1]GFE58327.1 HD family phosphohydrolase [Geobacter sp. AOG1]
MDPTALLQHYFADAPEAGTIVLEHSRLVAAKALQITDHCCMAGLDRQFIEEAALLHDIGVCRVHAPGMGLIGANPYICHGILGREILEREGLARHALVCERHIGVGLTIEDIRAQQLPLPHRDMVPVSREEQIVCCADLFYSKHPGKIAVEKSLADVKQSLARFGSNKVSTFETWQQLFSLT